jgi:hypothetical protein
MEMAVTITYTNDAPGRGGWGGPLRALGSGQRAAVLAVVQFDSSYPSPGGEDISELFNHFKRVDAVFVNNFPITGKLVQVDKTNKKLLVFTAIGTEATNATDQSTVFADIMIVGVPA